MALFYTEFNNVSVVSLDYAVVVEDTTVSVCTYTLPLPARRIAADERRDHGHTLNYFLLRSAGFTRAECCQVAEQIADHFNLDLYRSPIL